MLKLLISDKEFIKKLYKIKFGKELNLNTPKSFNEKIQWLKLYYRNNIYTKCADKFLVREYVEEIIGQEILNELFNVYDRVEDIDLSVLPVSFVLKVTFGSGQNIICKDKSKINWKYTYKLLKLFTKSNLYYYGREWAYKNISPKIICEKYLSECGKPPNDYKIFCFNGKPKFVQVDFDRFESHKRNIYDMNWNQINVEYVYPNLNIEIPKPNNFDLMIKYASKLSNNIPFVRIDFYLVNNKIIFGEMTFYPESGFGKFYPPEFDVLFGKYLSIPEIK